METTDPKAIWSQNDAIEQEALHGVPPFYEIPEELTSIIQRTVLAKERMFWLRSNAITRDMATTILLRRAVYAETRCWEMENRIAEMALIANGAKERVEELEGQLNLLAKVTL